MAEQHTLLMDFPSLGAQHKTLTEQVFHLLSNAVLSGAVREGDRLSETELAERLGISRAPVREALAELVKQGLVVHLPRKGTFVATWTKDDLWEVAILRCVLEGLAARLATAAIEPSDVRYLEDIIRRMEVADEEADLGLLFDLDFAFHRRIWERARHNRLKKALEDLKLQIMLFMKVTRPADMVSYPELHWILLEAICSKDPIRAEESINAHIMDTATLALEALPDDDCLWDRVIAFGSDR